MRAAPPSHWSVGDFGRSSFLSFPFSLSVGGLDDRRDDATPARPHAPLLAPGSGLAALLFSGARLCPKPASIFKLAPPPRERQLHAASYFELLLTQAQKLLLFYQEILKNFLKFLQYIL